MAIIGTSSGPCRTAICRERKPTSRPARPKTLWKLAKTFWIWRAWRVPDCGIGREGLAGRGASELTCWKESRCAVSGWRSTDGSSKRRRNGALSASACYRQLTSSLCCHSQVPNHWETLPQADSLEGVNLQFQRPAQRLSARGNWRLDFSLRAVLSHLGSGCGCDQRFTASSW